MKKFAVLQKDSEEGVAVLAVMSRKWKRSSVVPGPAIIHLWVAHGKIVDLPSFLLIDNDAGF